MKADVGGFGPVEIECLHGFLDVGPQLVPGIALREDAFGQALGAVPAISLLGHLENNFAHNLEFKRSRRLEQAASGRPCRARLVCERKHSSNTTVIAQRRN